jgi:nucleoside-diphosphate-sugar epimerase
MILELADAVERALGTRLGRDFTAARAGDVRHSTLDADRLNAVGWRPTVDLDAGLAELAGNMADPSDGARDVRSDGAA